MSQTAKEVCYIRNLLNSIGFPQQSTVLYGDNQGALFLGDNPKTSSRTKHIAIKYHHIRELTEMNTLTLVYLETKRMVADLLTKPLPKATITKLFAKLMNEPI